MRSKQWAFLIASLLVAVIINAQKIKDDFSPLHSLVGTWKMETSKGALFETWEKLNDSTLKGDSYKVIGSDTTWLERVQLVKRRGNIQYIPFANGQNNNEAVVFTLKDIADAIYTFENATHDFPQRIVYKLPGNNSLEAWIEGKINSQFKKVGFKYIKMPVK